MGPKNSWGHFDRAASLAGGCVMTDDANREQIKRVERVARPRARRVRDRDETSRRPAPPMEVL